MKVIVAVLLVACVLAQVSAYSSRITGGQPATPHSFPYQAALFITFPRGKTGFCGGSVISDIVILTAAHCVQGATKAKVVLGAHYVKTNETTTQTFQSKKFITHKRWNTIFKHNDIALVILSEQIVFNEYVQKIELHSGESISAGQEATVSGWGLTSDEAQSISPELYYVTSEILDIKECNLWYFGGIDDTQICLNGADKKSSCRGDSGGPLTTSIDGKLVQIGIVSFGQLKCESGSPSVYTDVNSYIGWIEKHYH